jgi:hypothetical protein
MKTPVLPAPRDTEVDAGATSPPQQWWSQKSRNKQREQYIHQRLPLVAAQLRQPDGSRSRTKRNNSS